MSEPIMITHSRGFPGWGPPTLCGAEGPVPDPCGEITCPDCVPIVGSAPKLMARVEALAAEIGPPKEPPPLHLQRGRA